MGESQFFTTLDLESDFYQIELAETQGKYSIFYKQRYNFLENKGGPR